MQQEKTIEVAAERRTVIGKQVRHLRRQGLVPAVVYGHGGPSLPVQFAARALKEALARAGTNSPITLRVDGNTHTVIIRKVERNPVDGNVQHVDLQDVRLDEPIRARLPIVLTGEAPAAKGGALVLRVLDHLNVEGIPTALPHAVHADISHLTERDASLHVSDLELPDGVTVLDNGDEVVVKIAESAAEEAEEEAAPEAATPAAEQAEAPSEETPEEGQERPG